VSVAPAWRVERIVGDVAGAHAADPTAAPAVRRVRVHEFARPALVLGSAQPEQVVDASAAALAGIDVVRRRSGGGAVLLVPGEVVWVDVVVPAGDPLWHEDIGTAFHWLGESWAAALGAHGVREVAVHRGGLVRTRWSELVCFAGIGPGEVVVAGRKAVGISQRRTRHAARFQAAALLSWDAVGILSLFDLTPTERAAAAAELAEAAGGVPVPGPDLVAAFLAALP
jgi:lipoate-protein ligase A